MSANRGPDPRSSDQALDTLHAGGVRVDLGHRNRLAATLADPGTPRDPCRALRRRQALAGWPAGVVPQLTGLSQALPAAGASSCAAIRRPPRARAVASYVDGAPAGVPAVTRHDFGQGTAWYVATRLDNDSVARLTSRIVAEAGVEAVAETAPGVEVVRRRGVASTYLFVLNHTDAPAIVPANGVDLLTDEVVTGKLELAGGDVAVIREGG